MWPAWTGSIYRLASVYKRAPPFSMAIHRLDNYLRTYRRRAAFSQEEIAYLLGGHDSAKISHYERLTRKPSLETVLAYEAILRRPVRELFAGTYPRAEKRAVRRARLLKRRLLANGNCRP